MSDQKKGFEPDDDQKPVVELLEKAREIALWYEVDINTVLYAWEIKQQRSNAIFSAAGKTIPSPLEIIRNRQCKKCKSE